MECLDFLNLLPRAIWRIEGLGYLGWQRSCTLKVATRISERECPNMRHQQVRDYRQFIGETVHRLPDGRHLVMDFDHPAKVIDMEGGELAPSPSEVIALLALARMTSANKKTDRKSLLSRQHDEEDWLLAG